MTQSRPGSICLSHPFYLCYLCLVFSFWLYPWPAFRNCFGFRRFLRPLSLIFIPRLALLGNAALLFLCLAFQPGVPFRSFSSTHLILSLAALSVPDLAVQDPFPLRCAVPASPELLLAVPWASYVVFSVTPCCVFTILFIPMRQLFFLCKFSACVIWQVSVV